MKKNKIALIKSNRAYLPEIDHYITYLSSDFEVCVSDTTEDLKKYDILWYFMGTVGRRYRKDQIVIHEYASSSVGKFPKIKDFIKSLMVFHKPNARVFLNKNVFQQFNFLDSTTYFYRDMGTPSIVPELFNQNYEYDIVYVGATKGRSLENALNFIFDHTPSIKILIIGEHDDTLISRTKPNIEFTGKVPHHEVFNYINKGKLALNWVPDVHPYNIQTSTKFLEYLCLNKIIISNKYFWVDEYCHKTGATYIPINDINRIVMLLKDQTPSIKQPKPESWTEVMESSGIKEYLLKITKS